MKLYSEMIQEHFISQFMPRHEIREFSWADAKEELRHQKRIREMDGREIVDFLFVELALSRTIYGEREDEVRRYIYQLREFWNDLESREAILRFVGTSLGIISIEYVPKFRIPSSMMPA